jgi:aryl-alcohol dehydrogenase-like predicted oxidoreductase
MEDVTEVLAYPVASLPRGGVFSLDGLREPEARAHLEDNLAAAALRLDQDEIHAITAAVSQP